MRLGITSKIVLLIVSSVVISSLAVLLAGRFSFESGFLKEYQHTIGAYKNVGAELVAIARHQALSEAKAQAIRPNVIEGLAAGNGSLLSRLCDDLKRMDATGTVLFTNTAGEILAATGDATAVQAAIRERQPKLMAGGETVGFVADAGGRLPLLASVPVRQGGNIVGGVTVAVDLTAGDNLVDALKSMLDVEATLFVGMTRLSSTILENGRRVTGTTIADQEVIQQVLGAGQTVSKTITLFGKPYMAVYWPLLTADAKPVGIGFVGKDMAQLDHSLGVVNRNASLCALVVVTLLAGLGFGFSKAFTRPLLALVAFSRAVAEGRLEERCPVDSRDEVGELAASLGRMVAALRDKIDEAEEKTQDAKHQTEMARQAMAEAETAERLAESKAEEILTAAGRLEAVVEIVSAASEELSAQIEQSSRGAEEQSHRMGETATSMEEMNATVLEVAKSASNAAQAGDLAKTKAEDGADIVELVVKGIGEVRQQAREMQADMGALGQAADNIGQILEVISDIADQTNLLALNAAIEAARAGDAGRGFAVVADAVRKLAEKTMTATREVGAAIQGIQAGTQKNIANVERSGKTIEEATLLANKSGEALREIVSLVESTSDQVRSIATASEQQSATSEEINRSIEEVSRIASETADAMGQSALAVGELASQSLTLKNLIGEMQAGD